MYVVHRKIFFFVLSAIAVVFSLVAIATWGLRPSVDFTGGSSILLTFEGTQPTPEFVREGLTEMGFEGVVARETDDGILVRTKPLGEGDETKILETLTSDEAVPSIGRLSSIGPSVGEQLRRKTMWAIILVVLAIIFYVAFTFRKVSKPISSWWYGLIAIVTLLHDIIIPTGVFAVLGHYSGLEADTLFIVALLTILALSVNDTIVVFDRIREHLRLNQEHNKKEEFGQTVGKSLEETYGRSFNTSLTIIIVLVALYILGGATIHSFVLTLLVGMIVGTYSSIFLASPLLVVIGERKLAAAERTKRR